MLFHPTLPSARSRRYKIRGAGILLALGEKICLQRRTLCAKSRPDELTHWGGEVEFGETVLQGACRELKEEVGLNVTCRDLVVLGAHEYRLAGGRSLAARLFLRIPAQTPLVFDEGAPEFFDNATQALQARKLDPIGTTWSIREAVRRRLVPA